VKSAGFRFVHILKASNVRNGVSERIQIKRHIEQGLICDLIRSWADVFIQD
jgi:hypothetical protein